MARLTESGPATILTVESPPSSGTATIVFLASLAAVILADRVEAAARDVRPEVGVAPWAGRGDRHGGLRARIEPVEAAIGEIGEDDDAAGHHVRATAVFVVTHVAHLSLHLLADVE